MALQSLNLGENPDDGTGDTLRIGGDKINDNFSEIYTLLGTGNEFTSGLSATATVVTLSSAVGTFTTLTPVSADGAALGSASLEWSDLFLADGAIINLGSDQDVTLTHVADTGILLNSTRQLQFGDSGTYIHQSADGVLDLVSDTEIEINATTIDINGAVDVSGNATFAGGSKILTASNGAFELEISGALTLSSGEDNGGSMIFKVSDANKMTLNSSGNLAVTGTVGATAITASGKLITDDTTEATSTTDGSLQTDGGLSVAKDVVAGDDVKLLSDAAVLAFGADGDVTLTHVADTGLLLNSTMQLQFNDASQNINAPSATVLDINATDEIELNATLVDVNANLDASGTVTFGSLSDGTITATAFVDEDNMASDSATLIPTQQSVKAYVDAEITSSASSFVLEDDDGTEVTVSNNKEVKFIGSGITTNWTDTDNGTDGDPYDLTFTVDAAQTGITSLLATDIKIGEDDQTKIDFETADEIHFYAANAHQVKLVDGALVPVTDNDIDLGTSSLEFKDAFFDGTVTSDALTVDNVVINGATIGHGDDTDLMTVADGILTVAGTVNLSTLAIGGTNVTSTAAEINYLDITTLGTTQASKAVTTDSNGDVLFPDGDKVRLGAGADLILQHDGSHSYIQNSTGNLNLQGKSGENGIVLVPDGAVTLYHDNAAKLATNSGGVTVTGQLAATDIGVSGSGNRAITITSSDGIASMEIGAAADNAAFIDFKTPSSDDFDMRVSSEAAGAGGNISIAGGTFTINGSGETMATFADDGAVSLYHNNAVKIATQSGGVTVTGVVAATTMTGTVTTATQNSITTMTGLVTTGALNSGTITSGFGTINNGSSTITTTGAVATGTVTAGGAITSTGNITAFSSDPRLKNFKGKINNPLEKLNKINGYYYEWNDVAKGIDSSVFKDGLAIGVDASEIEAVMPEIVDIAPIVAYHNLDVDYKTVHYDLIVPLLIEAVKELQAEVMELKSKGSK